MYAAWITLRQVMNLWKTGLYDGYGQVQERPSLFVYVLSHKYDVANMKSKKPELSSTLKGPDGRKLAHLLPLAKELGITVRFANLTYTHPGRIGEMERSSAEISDCTKITEGGKDVLGTASLVDEGGLYRRVC